MEGTNCFKCPILAGNPSAWLSGKCIQYMNPNMKATVVRHHILDHHCKKNKKLNPSDKGYLDPQFFNELTKLDGDLKTYNDEQLWHFIYQKVVESRNKYYERHGMSRPMDQPGDDNPKYSSVWLGASLQVHGAALDLARGFVESPTSPSYEIPSPAAMPMPMQNNSYVLLNNNFRVANEATVEAIPADMDQGLINFMTSLQASGYVNPNNQFAQPNVNAKFLQFQDDYQNISLDLPNQIAAPQFGNDYEEAAAAAAAMQSSLAAIHNNQQHQQFQNFGYNPMYDAPSRQYEGNHPQDALRISTVSSGSYFSQGSVSPVSPIDWSASTDVGTGFGF